MSKPGGQSPIRRTGVSRQRPSACSSTGAITSSSPSRRSSARSKPSRRPYGWRRSRGESAATIACARTCAAPTRGPTPSCSRIALKMATGSGKTTVMAMLIAWQTVNAVRTPGSNLYSRGFLVVTPGITIKDRLRVLQPNDPGQLLPCAANSSRPTCCRRSARPRSSSPTSTPSNAARRWRSARPAAHCSRAATRRRRRSRTTARCCIVSPTNCWASRASSC